MILYWFKTHLWTTIPTANFPINMKGGPFTFIRILNKWMRNALLASCSHFELQQTYAWLHQKRPMTTCQRLGEGLGLEHFKVYSVSQWNQKTQPLSYYNLLCPSSTLLLLCHTSIRATEHRCWLPVWPGILAYWGTPIYTCMPPVPPALPCEGRKIDMHMGKSTF